MRYASPLAAAAVVIAAVAVLQQGALAQASNGTIVWSTHAPGAASMITSQVFAPDANVVYYNVLQRVSNATKDGYVPKTCLFSRTSGVTLCAQGSGGSTFELAPSAAGPSSLANLTNDAVSISTRATAATAGNSDVDFLSATTQKIVSASFLNASFEAAVPYFNQGEILARWTDIGQASTFIARFAISPGALTVTWMNSYPHQQDSRLAPSGATNVFAYEDFTFFIVQDLKKALLYKVDASDPDPIDNVYFALANPCGLVPTNDSLVHFRIAPYDIFNGSQVLSAMLLWGKMANGVPAICRVSHRFGTSNWNISGVDALTFPTIDKILTLSLGAGIAVVTGNSATDGTKNLLFAFDARTGQLLWTDSRAASDAGSVPTVDQYTQQVYYQKNGNLVFAIATTGVARTTPKTGCVLPPVVTPRRVYCVNSGHTRIVAYAPLSDEIIFNWTAPATIAFPPVVVPNDAGTFVVALDNGNVVQVTSNLPTPPPGPTTTAAPGSTTNKPTGPTPKPGPTPTGGGAAPDSDDNKKNIIIAAVVIPVGVLFGGGIAFFLIRKRSSARRVARPEDIEAAINADDNLYNAA